MLRRVNICLVAGLLFALHRYPSNFVIKTIGLSTLAPIFHLSYMLVTQNPTVLKPAVIWAWLGFFLVLATYYLGVTAKRGAYEASTLFSGFFQEVSEDVAAVKQRAQEEIQGVKRSIKNY
jgi:hypothetical protein